MDYFISILDKPYHLWQIDLLIESFKNINLQDDLIISLTKQDPTPIKDFYNNISKHKKIYNFLDVGYESISKLYSLSYLLKEGKIKQPLLFLLEPDLVIKKEVQVPEEKEILDFLYFSDSSFTFEESEKYFPEFWKILNLDEKDCRNHWIYLGDIMIFNNFPQVFFDNLVLNADLLARNQKEVWKNTLKLALVLSLIEVKNIIRITENHNITMPAMSIGGDAHFIDYKKGIVPNFHKSMFTYSHPDYLSLGNPLKVLAEIYNCPNTKYISDLANSCLKSKL
jgi:hypothetical protein